MKKSFMYDGAFLWNSIPREIRGSTSLNSFRKKSLPALTFEKTNEVK
jgi:hypothetical protein